jgi:hypothetical protein
MVNPQARQAVGQAALLHGDAVRGTPSAGTFVATTDVFGNVNGGTYTSSGSGTLQIRSRNASSPLVSSRTCRGSGQQRAITLYSTTAQTSAQSLAFHKNAFTLVSADLPLPGGVDMAARASHKDVGFSMRVVRQYTINNDALPTRIDVLYGMAPLYRSSPAASTADESRPLRGPFLFERNRSCLRATPDRQPPPRNNTSVGFGNIAMDVLLGAALSPAIVAANTTAEQTFTVTGLAVGDMVTVNKPTAQAGLGIVGARVSAANTLAITFSNNTASGITPTAAETYVVNVIRPMRSTSAPCRPRCRCNPTLRGPSQFQSPCLLTRPPRQRWTSSRVPCARSASTHLGKPSIRRTPTTPWTLNGMLDLWSNQKLSVYNQIETVKP